MKVLVTGGAGYIGSHTVSELMNSNYEVVVLDNLSTGFRDAVDSKIPFYVGDIADQKILQKIFKEHKIDVVIHFAARLIVEESVTNPELYYSNNLVGSLQLFKVCLAMGIKKVIFSSTAAVYGDARDEAMLNEKSLCQPINPYGKTKFFIERMLQDLANATTLKYVILRYFNVAGADVGGKNGQRTKGATHLIKVASEAAVGKREQVHVYGTDYPTKDGTCVRDYIHVQDLAQAHIKALEYLVNDGESEIFNCGYGKGYSVLEVLENMKKTSGKHFDITLSPRRKGDAPAVVSDVQKIKSSLNWKPQYDKLDTICDSAFKWESAIGKTTALNKPHQS